MGRRGSISSLAFSQARLPSAILACASRPYGQRRMIGQPLTQVSRPLERRQREQMIAGALLAFSCTCVARARGRTIVGCRSFGLTAGIVVCALTNGKLASPIYELADAGGSGGLACQSLH